MAEPGTAAWMQEVFGNPCQQKLRTILFCGKRVAVNHKARRAFKRLSRLFQENSPNYASRIKVSQDTGAYNCRHIGSDPSRPWSNHAWATAIDVLWNANPQGVAGEDSDIWRFARAVIKKAEREGLFRWGGHWNDSHHFDLMMTPGQLKAKYTWNGKLRRKHR